MMRMVSSWEPAAVSLTDYLNEDGEGVKKRRVIFAIFYWWLILPVVHHPETKFEKQHSRHRFFRRTDSPHSSPLHGAGTPTFAQHGNPPKKKQPVMRANIPAAWSI